ncbi:glycosyltransferase [Nakamurella flava]|uniref:Glycosyltransferase n=1 Tax=Nakamurella flava TaxID=2576308 RepID=A0A4U6QNP0_9ACTN|nr:glycosyltransferase [Nakamurella flava]TKV61682.1 glycosyltransferase [Nakamurella flava]
MRTTAIIATVGRAVLAEQLAALAEQVTGPDQIVVVHNGVPGAVDAVIDRWRDALPVLELIEVPSDRTVAAARNAGAQQARFDGLLFLDDDDVVAPGYTAAVAAALDGADIVAAHIDLDALNRPRLRAGWGDMQSHGPMTHHDFLPWSSGCALSVRRAAFDQVGGFDESLTVTEDTDLCWRMQLAGARPVVFAADAVVHYRLRDRPVPAFRQARQWAMGEAELTARFENFGLRPRSIRDALRWKEIRRWARPVSTVVTARHRDDLVVASRSLGGCVGRLQGARRGNQLVRRVEVRSGSGR